ncbi:MAG: ATP-binding protein [Paludibacter sp.]
MFKIAILGPESTGKSTLTKALAEHFDSHYVTEYAREYVENLKVPYNFNDICNIAQIQIEQELYFEKNPTSQFVFFDTELIITKVWFDFKYAKVPDFLIERLNVGFFDLYLLCTPDLTWEPDPLREHGSDREFFFDWYKREIELIGKPYCIVSGVDYQRQENAVKCISSFFKLVTIYE